MRSLVHDPWGSVEDALAMRGMFEGMPGLDRKSDAVLLEQSEDARRRPLGRIAAQTAWRSHAAAMKPTSHRNRT